MYWEISLNNYQFYRGENVRNERVWILFNLYNNTLKNNSANDKRLYINKRINKLESISRVMLLQMRTRRNYKVSKHLFCKYCQIKSQMAISQRFLLQNLRLNSHCAPMYPANLNCNPFNVQMYVRKSTKGMNKSNSTDPSYAYLWEHL